MASGNMDRGDKNSACMAAPPPQQPRWAFWSLILLVIINVIGVIAIFVETRSRVEFLHTRQMQIEAQQEKFGGDIHGVSERLVRIETIVERIERKLE